MAAQLSMKAALPLAKRIATALDNCNNKGPWFVNLTVHNDDKLLISTITMTQKRSFLRITHIAKIYVKFMTVCNCLIYPHQTEFRKQLIEIT